MTCTQFFLGLAALLVTMTAMEQPSLADDTDSTSVVVVELFTSQGCSSCPSADAVLAKIDRHAKANGETIIGLSFHVDYWNRLGWDDPYSSELYSRRQRAYARAIDSSRVYTPQMIVNGTTEFVGSHSKKAASAIAAAKRVPSSTTVDLQVGGISDGMATMRYEVSGHSAGDVLNVAVFHTPKKNRVPRGENSGRELSHVNVVRVFKIQKLDETSGQVEIDLPADVEPSELKVVGYVQNLQRLEITGASVVALPTT